MNIYMLAIASLCFTVSYGGTTNKSMYQNLMKTCRGIHDRGMKKECFKVATFFTNNKYFLTPDDEMDAFPVKKSSSTCPSLAKIKSATRTNMRSLSPWKYTLNYDKKRFPVVILEAKCLCEGCLNVMTGKEDLDYSSSPISIEIPVIKSTSVDRIEDCTIDTCESERETIAVACFCAVK